MALIEMTTRKIEIDEINDSHIHIRTTTHLVDSETNEVVYPSIRHHRSVIKTGDDNSAAEQGLTVIANEVWTPQARSAQTARESLNNASINASPVS